MTEQVDSECSTSEGEIKIPSEHPSRKVCEVHSSRAPKRSLAARYERKNHTKPASGKYKESHKNHYQENASIATHFPPRSLCYSDLLPTWLWTRLRSRRRFTSWSRFVFFFPLFSEVSGLIVSVWGQVDVRTASSIRKTLFPLKKPLIYE